MQRHLWSKLVSVVVGVLLLGLLAPIITGCEEEIPKVNPNCEAPADGIANWATDVRPIIVVYCAECHRPERASGGIILSAFDAIEPVARSGRLLGVIRHEPGYNPMPYNNPRLDSCSISIFELWIEQGIQNN